MTVIDVIVNVIDGKMSVSAESKKNRLEPSTNVSLSNGHSSMTI